jgi:hypothetical protein
MRQLLTLFVTALLVVSNAGAWGASMHRLVTEVALDALPADAPSWLRNPETRQRAAFEANQPDRWRGWPSLVLQHANEPEHYLDFEDLGEFGLTPETIPELRMEYVRVMTVAKEKHPEKISPYDAGKDPARAREWPGFLLHAIAEHYAKLQAAFNQERILEQVNNPAHRLQLEEARALAIYHLGELSHFVADAAQPLHTTKHYNGWIGENPAGYRWRERFHSYIDEGWAKKHGVNAETLRPHVKPDTVKLHANDPWADVVAYVGRSHAQLEPLYALERDGKLDGEPGREMAFQQLGDGTSMLAALIWAAYTSAEPTEKQVSQWVMYDGQHTAASKPASAPATQPAPVSP